MYKKIRFFAKQQHKIAVFGSYQRLILIVCQNFSNAIFDRVLVGLYESARCADEDRDRL